MLRLSYLAPAGPSARFSLGSRVGTGTDHPGRVRSGVSSRSHPGRSDHVGQTAHDD